MSDFRCDCDPTRPAGIHSDPGQCAANRQATVAYMASMHAEQPTPAQRAEAVARIDAHVRDHTGGFSDCPICCPR